MENLSRFGAPFLIKLRNDIYRTTFFKFHKDLSSVVAREPRDGQETDENDLKNKEQPIVLQTVKRKNYPFKSFVSVEATEKGVSGGFIMDREGGEQRYL